MELLGVIVALESLKKAHCEALVHSDSKYVVDAFEKHWLEGWIKKDFKKIKNPDLWKRLLALTRKHKVKFKWVKGHADNVENNRCDELAVAAYKLPGLKEDEGYLSSQEPILGL